LRLFELLASDVELLTFICFQSILQSLSPVLRKAIVCTSRSCNGIPTHHLYQLPTVGEIGKVQSQNSKVMVPPVAGSSVQESRLFFFKCLTTNDSTGASSQQSEWENWGTELCTTKEFLDGVWIVPNRKWFHCLCYDTSSTNCGNTRFDWNSRHSLDCRRGWNSRFSWGSRNRWNVLEL
jgi:hypothetical protein